jgi:hypothetical protein
LGIEFSNFKNLPRLLEFHASKVTNPKTVDTFLEKEGSLFVLFWTYEIHQTGMLQIAFWVSRGSSQGGGVHWLGSMTFGLAVQKFLNIE